MWRVRKEEEVLLIIWKNRPWRFLEVIMVLGTNKNALDDVAPEDLPEIQERRVYPMCPSLAPTNPSVQVIPSARSSSVPSARSAKSRKSEKKSKTHRSNASSKSMSLRSWGGSDPDHRVFLGHESKEWKEGTNIEPSFKSKLCLAGVHFPSEPGPATQVPGEAAPPRWVPKVPAPLRQRYPNHHYAPGHHFGHLSAANDMNPFLSYDQLGRWTTSNRQYGVSYLHPDQTFERGTKLRCPTLLVSRPVLDRFKAENSILFD